MSLLVVIKVRYRLVYKREVPKSIGIILSYGKFARVIMLGGKDKSFLNFPMPNEVHLTMTDCLANMKMRKIVQRALLDNSIIAVSECSAVLFLFESDVVAIR